MWHLTHTLNLLSLKSNDQRAIVEQLLGITLLSEKADTLREKVKTTKDPSKRRRVPIKGIESKSTYQRSKLNPKRRSKMWEDKKDEDIQKLQKAIVDLGDVDIDKELEQHRLLSEYTEKKNKIESQQVGLKALFVIQKNKNA